MFAYQRSTSHGTAIQRILTGSLTGSLPQPEVVLIKPTSLELLQLNSSDDDNDIDEILSVRFEQPSFGSISDARTVRLVFNEEDDEDTQISYNDQDDDDDDEEPDVIDFPYVLKVRQEHARILGNNVIIMISEYGKLVFLSVSMPDDDLLNYGRFEPLVEICMDEPGLEYSKVNKKLAVDPHSRAIAIASFEDRFDIMVLGESMSRTHFDPIIGRGSISEEGIIWHMEFLYTESASRDRILLALMVFNDLEVQCRVIIYAIDASNPEDVLIERVGRLPLDTNAPIPILFIPLQHQPEAFLMITQYEAALITMEDVICGNTLYATYPIPQPFGEVSRCLLLTAYAFPVDDGSTPYMYIGSDMGCLFKLSFPSSGHMEWNLLGRVNPVGTSMSVLGVLVVPTDESESGDYYTADILLCSGEGADSQVLAIDKEGKRSPMVVQTFCNRAPLTDLRVGALDESGQSVIVSHTGQGEQGALCLIKRGIRAQMLSESPNIWKGISQIWSTVVSDAGAEPLPLLIVSSALNSRVLSTRRGDIGELEQLQSDKQLVAVGSFVCSSRSYLVQVYPDEVIVIDFAEQSLVCARWTPIKETITLAAISDSARDSGQIALTLFHEGQVSLMTLTIGAESGHNEITFTENPRLLCQAEPSYIGYIQVRNCSILAVGTFKPSIQLYDTSAPGMQLLYDIDLATIQGLDGCAVPHSTATLTYGEHNEQSVLMVGLRVGSIVCFQIAQQGQQLFDKSSHPFIRQLGNRPVKFDSTQSTDPSSLLALSDQLWKICCTSLYPDIVELEPVLLPSKRYVQAVVSFSIDGLHNDTTGIIADGCFQVVKPAHQSAVTAEKIPLTETPTRLMLDSAFPQNVFVLTSTVDRANFRNRNTLRLVDIRSMDTSRVLLSERAFQPADEVLCMAEWSLHHRSKTYRYLCVGTGQMNLASNRTRIKKIGSERGSLMIYRLKHDNSRGNGYALRPVMNKDSLPGGVFAICPHPAGLLFSAGPVLYLYQLDTDGKEAKLIEITKKTLRFLITSIHVEGERICIACQTDSISYYRLDPETNKLDFCKSDLSARTIHHSMMLSPQLVVGSNQSGGLVALWDDPEDRSFEQRLLTCFAFHYPDILIRPSLASLLPRTTLDVVTHARAIDGHLLSWKQHNDESSSDDTSIKPILSAGVSGGLISVHRLSEPLYNLLFALQERLVDYAHSLFIPLGSSHDFRWYRNLSQQEKRVLHGDLLSLYLRLPSDQQRQVVQVAESVENHKLPCLFDATKAFLDCNPSLYTDYPTLLEEQDPMTNATMSIEIASLLDQTLRALERCC